MMGDYWTTTSLAIAQGYQITGTNTSTAPTGNHGRWLMVDDAPPVPVMDELAARTPYTARVFDPGSWLIRKRPPLCLDLTRGARPIPATAHGIGRRTRPRFRLRARARRVDDAPGRYCVPRLRRSARCVSLVGDFGASRLRLSRMRYMGDFIQFLYPTPRASRRALSGSAAPRALLGACRRQGLGGVKMPNLDSFSQLSIIVIMSLDRSNIGHLPANRRILSHNHALYTAAGPAQPCITRSHGSVMHAQPMHIDQDQPAEWRTGSHLVRPGGGRPLVEGRPYVRIATSRIFRSPANAPSNFFPRRSRNFRPRSVYA